MVWSGLLVRCDVKMKVATPACNESARSAALCELVVRLVNDSLVEYSYAAYVSELQYDLKATDMGFEVRFFPCFRRICCGFPASRCSWCCCSCCSWRVDQERMTPGSS